jgi:hypothetical protein
MKERGQASIVIELDNGVITVAHGTDKEVLAQWVAKQGDWKTIWEVLTALNNGNDVSIKEF